MMFMGKRGEEAFDMQEYIDPRKKLESRGARIIELWVDIVLKPSRLIKGGGRKTAKPKARPHTPSVRTTTDKSSHRTIGLNGEPTGAFDHLPILFYLYKYYCKFYFT